MTNLKFVKIKKREDNFPLFFYYYWYMKKRLLFLISAIAVFLLSGCASEQKIYTSGSSSEQIIFIRPVEQKIKQTSLKEIKFDVKMDFDGSVVTSDPIINYSMTIGKNDYRKFENTVLNFEVNGELISTKNHTVLFRDVVNSKQMIVRISSVLSVDEFYKIIDSETPVTVKLIKENQVISEFISADFEDKLFDLRLILL